MNKKKSSNPTNFHEVSSIENQIVLKCSQSLEWLIRNKTLQNKI